MTPRAAASKAILISIWILAAFLLVSCLSSDGRIAGSSTEAGNAGGKLSMADGEPAEGVSVALVSHGFLPDTSGLGGSGDVEGKYYRTRTDTDGNFRFQDVPAGSYRIMAVDSSLGVSVDSLPVRPGENPAFIREVMKPLGGISGIAKIIGSSGTSSRVWISVKATLLRPALADAEGAFRLDSLPEGDYELVPQCFSCRPVAAPYRVSVKAGAVTILNDTLKLYPEYFFGFPDSGDLFIRSAWLPIPIGGKINRGDDYRMLPASVTWTWNGVAIPGADLAMPEGVSETSVRVESSWFDSLSTGSLKLVLHYPDTAVAREWRVSLDTSVRVWPLSAVAVSGAVRIPGPVDKSVWRFHVADARPLDPAAAAFWRLDPGIRPDAFQLPEWIDLGAEEADLIGIGGLDTAHFTFFLVPDSLTGGRVFRLRRDERLEDIGRIRYLELAHFRFADSLEPSMRPDGLVVDRRRGSLGTQRYHIDSVGAIREMLGGLSPAAKPDAWPAEAGAPLLFHRSGPAAAGFLWDKPLKDAASLLAVTEGGLAMRLDGSTAPIRISASEMESLLVLLKPISEPISELPMEPNGLDAPNLADTASLTAVGELEYAHARGRGVLWNAGTRPAADELSAGIRAWMARNGLGGSPLFRLEPGLRTWLAFVTDSSGWRYTGDTLVAEMTDSVGGAVVTERLTSGSPGRTGDSAVLAYYLRVAGDSLMASADPPVISRLFGKIDKIRGLLPLGALEPVAPAFLDGIPVLTGGGNTLSGRLVGNMEIAGRQVDHPAVFLDGRAINSWKSGQGSLYTPEGGLERTWRFGGRTDSVSGWDKR